MINLIRDYTERLSLLLSSFDWAPVEELAEQIQVTMQNRRQVFICGNGGSAGNATHLANDFLYGIEPTGNAMRVEALPANTSVITCLGNDIGYENIFSHQLKVKASTGDLLIVLSGSGNSPNIVKALDFAKNNGIFTSAILGFSGGKAKTIAENVIHFEIDDMQISEDTQLIVGHILMQHLKNVLAS